MRPNDYIEEPYVYTREEELILKIECRKEYIAVLKKEIVDTRSLLNVPTFSEGFISRELKKAEKN